jgi:predicted transposase/invertase (TIGR01784 family)
MSFDNLCKLMAEKHPAEFANWLLGAPQEQLEVLKTELSIEPIRADSVIFLKAGSAHAGNRIIHIEFQTQWPSEPPIPLRELDYWVRLYRVYRIPIEQFVILLLPPKDETVITNVFRVSKTFHEFKIIKMWEQDPMIFLENSALLPFAPLAQTSDPEKLLNQVSQQVAAIPQSQDRLTTSSYVQILAGLKYDKNIIKQVFREDIMRESVIYQEIFQEGEKAGEQIGKEIGEQIGKEIGKEEERRTVAIKMLQEKIDLAIIARITGISIAELQQLPDNP